MARIIQNDIIIECSRLYISLKLFHSRTYQRHVNEVPPLSPDRVLHPGDDVSLGF